MYIYIFIYIYTYIHIYIYYIYIYILYIYTGDYLKKTLAHNYAHIIEISPLDWAILWGVMGLIFIIYYHFPELSMLIFFAFEVALGALSCIVLDKLTRIRAALVPSIAPAGVAFSYKPPECCPASGRRAPPPHLLAQTYKYWRIY
jgi:hypothetical protein